MSKKSEYQDVREVGFIFEEKVSMSGTIDGVDNTIFANMPFRIPEMLDVMQRFGVKTAIVRSRVGGKVGILSLGAESPETPDDNGG
jgi:hypothetical protein